MPLSSRRRVTATQHPRDRDAAATRRPQVYAKHLELIDADKEVDRIFRQVDTDGNGFIEFSEFVTVTVDKKKLLTKQRLKQAFSLFDNDGDGNIDIEEFKKIFQQVKADDKVWKSLISQVDENSDGEINFEEFQEMMTKIA